MFFELRTRFESFEIFENVCRALLCAARLFQEEELSCQSVCGLTQVRAEKRADRFLLQKWTNSKMRADPATEPKLCWSKIAAAIWPIVAAAEFAADTPLQGIVAVSVVLEWGTKTLVAIWVTSSELSCWN